MKGYIDGVNFVELEPMKYWSFGTSVCDETKKTTVRNAIFSGNYIGSLKTDGFYQRVVIDEDGNPFMIARNRDVNGEVIDKYEWVPHLHNWFAAVPAGTCFLVEAYLPGNEGSKNVTSILGCLRDKAIERQKATPLHFSVFDIMAYGGESYLNTPYEERTQALRKCAAMASLQSEYVRYVEFYEGEELWGKLQQYLAEGLEGMVIMRKDAIVYQKRTPARVSIKVKKELQSTIDCFFTGRTAPATHIYTGKEIETWPYWENQVTNELFNKVMFKEYQLGAPIAPVTKGYFNHWAGSLEIGVLGKGNRTYKLGKELCENCEIVSIGWLSNVSEEMKADPHKFAFIPLEVTAMELDYASNPPTLRHGRMIGWRPDLSLKDCTLEKME